MEAYEQKKYSIRNVLRYILVHWFQYTGSSVRKHTAYRDTKVNTYSKK